MHTFVFLFMGAASWFNPPQMYNQMHVCATNYRNLIGQRLEIENKDNGSTSWCTDIGTGPFVAGRVIDVSPLVRDDLGFYKAGVANVTVYQSKTSSRVCRTVPGVVTCIPQDCVVVYLPQPMLDCSEKF